MIKSSSQNFEELFEESLEHVFIVDESIMYKKQKLPCFLCNNKCRSCDNIEKQKVLFQIKCSKKSEWWIVIQSSTHCQCYGDSFECNFFHDEFEAVNFFKGATALSPKG